MMPANGILLMTRSTVSGILNAFTGCARQIGLAEGADMEILLTAALLHDAQGSHPAEGARNDHHIRSAEFAGKLLAEMGWDESRIQAVQACIIAHRYRKDDIPQSLEAKVCLMQTNWMCSARSGWCVRWPMLSR